MDAIIRAATVYGFVLVLTRLAGRRALAQLTTFDFILLLIISEAVQQAMIGDDFSVTNAFLVVTTLIGLDILFTYFKLRFPRLEKWIDGLPLIIVEDGRLLRDRMARARIDEEDILESARRQHGLESIDQIKYAVLERSGGISIVPRR